MRLTLAACGEGSVGVVFMGACANATHVCAGAAGVLGVSPAFVLQTLWDAVLFSSKLDCARCLPNLDLLID